MFLRTREFCGRRRPDRWRRICRLESIPDKQTVPSRFSNAGSGRAPAIDGGPCLDGSEQLRPIHDLVGCHGFIFFSWLIWPVWVPAFADLFDLYFSARYADHDLDLPAHIRLFGLTLIAITVVDYTFLSFAYISFFCFLAGLGTLHPDLNHRVEQVLSRLPGIIQIVDRFR